LRHTIQLTLAMQPKLILALTLLLPVLLFAQQKPFKRVIPLTPNPLNQHFQQPGLGLQETHSSSKVKVSAGQKIHISYSMEGKEKNFTANRIFKKVARAVGVGILAFQSNRIRNSKMTEEKFNPYTPAIAMGASMALPVKSKRPVRQNEGVISIDFFNKAGKFVGSQFIKEGKKMRSYTVDEDGFVKISRLGKIDPELNRVKVEAVVTGMEEYSGSIVGRMDLATEGECLPEVIHTPCDEPGRMFTCECDPYFCDEPDPCEADPFSCACNPNFCQPDPCDTEPFSCECNPAYCEPDPGGGNDYVTYQTTENYQSGCDNCTMIVSHYVSGRVEYSTPTCQPITGCIPDPCNDNVKNNSSGATNFYNEVVNPIPMPFLATVGTNPNEYSFSISDKPQDDDDPATEENYTLEGVNSGTPNSVIQDYDRNTIAIGHTHPPGSYPAPSLKDIYVLNNVYTHSGICTNNYIYAADGSVYVLTITNPDQFSSFITAHPQGASVNAATSGFATGTGMYYSYQSAYNYFRSAGLSDHEAYEKAFAFVLGEADSGVTLMKKGADGNFSAVLTTSGTDASGNTTYTSTLCK
jgi:hypothetical protein